MGKKDIATMSRLKDNFIEGCLANEKFIEGCKQNNSEAEKLIEKYGTIGKRLHIMHLTSRTLFAMLTLLIRQHI